MVKRAYRRRFVDRIEDRDPNIMWMEFGDGYVVPYGQQFAAVGNGIVVVCDADILLQTRLVSLGERVDRGRKVDGTTLSWTELRKAVLQNPSLLDFFPVWHRKFEEFVAGGYVASSWSDVVLSPRAHDGGFDVAARKRGRQIMDEVKAYRPTLLVGHQVVRAALGLLVEHRNVHQVRVTTTSCFAPMVWPDFDHLIPSTLLLRDFERLLRWLDSIEITPN